MQNHYNCVFDEISKTYNFATKNGILYRLAFIVDQTFSAISGEDIANVFQLVIEKANENIEPYDPKVSRTVEDIIERFFQHEENSLIYICSDDNEKAVQRHKIFNRWYQNSSYKDKVKKIDNVISIEIEGKDFQNLYTSFLFHINNPEYNKLISIYKKIEEVLNGDK